MRGCIRLMACFCPARLGPAVGHGILYALAVHRVGTSTNWAVQAVAYDASGLTGCSGSPRQCGPVWSGPVSTTSSDVLTALDRAKAAPTVVNGAVFVRADRLRAYTLPAGA